MSSETDTNHAALAAGTAATHVDKASTVRQVRRDKARRWFLRNGSRDLAEMLGLFDPYEEG